LGLIRWLAPWTVGDGHRRVDRCGFSQLHHHISFVSPCHQYTVDNIVPLTPFHLTPLLFLSSRRLFLPSSSISCLLFLGLSSARFLLSLCTITSFRSHFLTCYIYCICFVDRSPFPPSSLLRCPVGAQRGASCPQFHHVGRMLKPKQLRMNRFTVCGVSDDSRYLL